MGALGAARRRRVAARRGRCAFERARRAARARGRACREGKETGRATYARAVAVLKRARRAAQAAGEGTAFATTLAQLRERHRRRPALIAMLDKAALS